MKFSEEQGHGLIGNMGEMDNQSERKVSLWKSASPPIRLAASMSPSPSSFAPLLFAGRLAEGLDALPGSGFTAVEISLRQANDLDVPWLDVHLAELGLAVSAFATGRMCLEDSLCLSDTNPIVRKQLFERLVGVIQLAAHFNASVIIGGVRGKLSGDADQRSDQRKSAIETLRGCAVVAEASGVNLLVEPINRYETNFINSAQDGIELIRVIGQPGIKLLLDTFHMNIEETDPCATIRSASRLLGYVHFADSNRQAPGLGHIKFPAILDALKDIEYQGFITAEILPLPDDSRALGRAGEYISTLLKEKR